MENGALQAARNTGTEQEQLHAVHGMLSEMLSGHIRNLAEGRCRGQLGFERAAGLPVQLDAPQELIPRGFIPHHHPAEIIWRDKSPAIPMTGLERKPLTHLLWASPTVTVLLTQIREQYLKYRVKKVLMTFRALLITQNRLTGTVTLMLTEDQNRLKPVIQAMTVFIRETR